MSFSGHGAPVARAMRSMTALTIALSRLDGTHSMNAVIAARRSPSLSSLGALFVVLWSSAWIAGEVGLPYAGPVTLIVIRFAAAGAVMLLIAPATGAPCPEKLIDYGPLAVAGALLQGLALGFAYFG